jgi:hypothetical protein
MGVANGVTKHVITGPGKDANGINRVMGVPNKKLVILAKGVTLDARGLLAVTNIVQHLFSDRASIDQ